MAKLVECLDKIEYKNPENVLQCPFDYAFGASLFDWLKAHPSSSHRYNAYMAGRRRGKASWIEHYPIRERLIDGANTGESVFIVDVAGNQGHDLDLLWDTYHKSGIPGRMILQDVVEKREAGSPASYEHMHYDFFTPQPIKGWSPAVCVSSFESDGYCPLK